MTFKAAPLKTALSDTYPNPSNATMRTGMGALWDWATSLLGTTGDPADARAALSAAESGVNSDITSVTFLPGINDFRLSLTTSVPVTTSDVTGATSIRAVPCCGNRIALYDGTNWNIRASAEFSLALGTLTSGLPYDVFAYDNSGTPTLEFTAWTNDTTRATALAYQDGVLVKSGAATRRYLGTFYTTSTTTTEDSAAKRYLWNYYHRTLRPMKRLETTASWSYSTSAWRQANASSLNQLNFVIGVSEDAVEVDVNAFCASSSSNTAYSAIGLDSTTNPTSRKAVQSAGAGNTNITSDSTLVSAGKHYLAWLEYAAGAGTATWYGQSGEIQTGMAGTVRG